MTEFKTQQALRLLIKEQQKCEACILGSSSELELVSHDLWLKHSIERFRNIQAEPVAFGNIDALTFTDKSAMTVTVAHWIGSFPAISIAESMVKADPKLDSHTQVRQLVPLVIRAVTIKSTASDWIVLSIIIQAIFEAQTDGDEAVAAVISRISHLRDGIGHPLLTRMVLDSNIALFQVLAQAGFDLSIISTGQYHGSWMNTAMAAVISGSEAYWALRGLTDKEQLKQKLFDGSTGYDSLSVACCYGNLDIAQDLLSVLQIDREYCVSRRYPRNASLLHLAVIGRNTGLLKLFLDMGIDLNSKDDDGETPLSIALAMKPTNKAAVLLLIDEGANVSSVDLKSIYITDQEILNALDLANLRKKIVEENPIVHRSLSVLPSVAAEEIIQHRTLR